MTPATRWAIGAAMASAVLAGHADVLAVRQDPAPGQILGRVTDIDRGVIPGATITLDGRRLQAPQTATSDARGAFQFTGLAAGAYFVRAQIRGFTTVTKENVAVTAGGKAELSISLPLAPLISKTMPTSGSLHTGEVGVDLETTLGDIYIAVDTVHAPITAANFLEYVDGGFYNLGRFHRVTRSDNYTPAPPNRPAMEIIQGGPDPFRFREGFPPIALERTSVTGLKHVPGTVSMARGNAADTGTSDFFICLDEQPSLDFGGKRFDDGQGAAAFGRVVLGMDVVARINQAGPLRPSPNQQYLQTPVQILRAVRFQK